MTKYVNSGALWPNKNKTSEKAPNVKGSIKLDPTFLSDLMDSAEGDLVEIELAGWTREHNGTKFVSLLASEPYKKSANANKTDDSSDVPF